MNPSSFHTSRQGCLLLAIFLCALACAAKAEAQSKRSGDAGRSAGQKHLQISAGTILPVRLKQGFSSKNAHAGQAITGRIMQDVPLPNDEKIPAGAKVRGTIVSVSPAGKNGAGKISLRFTEIEVRDQMTPVVTNLRALASFVEVQFAQTPEVTPGFGTPYRWATTDQIGGDIKYGVGGEVTDSESRTVGRGTYDGVLVRVRAQPEGACRGDLDGQDRLQALWVFSSDACGVYGMSGARIVHAGRTDPEGEIVLSAEVGDVKVHSGAGLLLRVL